MHSEFSALLQPIMGKNLMDKFHFVSKILFPDLVADTPGIALGKVERYFQEYPTRDGSNIYGINELRESIFEYSRDLSYINAFVIIAPHTHWLDLEPIIYHFDSINNRYLIGPHSLKLEEIYFPVSFIFYKNYPIPFEWSDSSINISQKDFSICMNIITQLNQSFCNKGYPLGIALDFRYKNGLFDTFGSTVELPDEDESSAYYGFSSIIDYSTFVNTKDRNDDSIQVAWHSNSLKLMSFSKSEETLFNDFRKLMASSSENEKIDIIKQIEAILKINKDSTNTQHKLGVSEIDE